MTPLVPEGRSRSITPRSVLLGLGGVIFICALSPYNDFALNNTFLVGNNLPLGVVMLTFGFVLLVNGPLHRWRPRWAFTPGELAVAMSMTLVACALPGSGLMRYLPPSLVSPYWQAQFNGEYRQLLESLNLPDWIFPRFRGATVADRINDPVVTGYLGRWSEEGPWPWRAWVRPALTWGAFTFALYGALLCMTTIVRRQWFDNERLSFPLAQIQLALIESPRPRRSLNATFASRSFWVAFWAVFFLHAWNGCGKYWPRYFPQIPVWYDLSGLFTEPPWTFAQDKLKDAAVFFTVVGVTYFLPGSVAFSLWSFFILHQVVRMTLGTTRGDPNIYGRPDQHFGGVLAFALTILWIGRAHWRLVLRQAFTRDRGETHGRYLPYRYAFWGMVGCAAVMVGFLWLAGCTPGGAVVLVLLLLLLFLVATRVIAETGLILGQLEVPLYRPWQMIAAAGAGRPVSLETFYVGGLVQTVHHDFREIVPVYATHGLKLADSTLFGDRAMHEDQSRDRRTGRRFVGLLFLALLVGYVVSFASTLATEYSFAWTRDVTHKMPINDWGTGENVSRHLLAPTVEYSKGVYNPRHSQVGHLAFGFGATLLLAFMRLRFAWWPLHPIGYLMMDTYPGNHLWFSIMLGWLAKALILRFGGSKLFVDAKPFFLGLIIGESAAVAFWLTMGVTMGTLGLPYRPVNIMPG